ncbi:hypothetical protein Tco_1571169, partial [Tanacetum coccineum]
YRMDYSRYIYNYVSLGYRIDKIFWDETSTITPLNCYGSCADVVAFACVIEIWLLKTSLSSAGYKLQLLSNYNCWKDYAEEMRSMTYHRRDKD